MGMFDSVYIQGAEGLKRIEFQIKDLDCQLATYSLVRKGDDVYLECSGAGRSSDDPNDSTFWYMVKENEFSGTLDLSASLHDLPLANGHDYLVMHCVFEDNKLVGIVISTNQHMSWVPDEFHGSGVVATDIWYWHYPFKPNTRIPEQFSNVADELLTWDCKNLFEVPLLLAAPTWVQEVIFPKEKL